MCAEPCIPYIGAEFILQIVAIAACKPSDEPVNEYICRLRKIFPLNPVDPGFSYPPTSSSSATLVANSEGFESQQTIDARNETELQSRIKSLQTHLERAEADAEVAKIKLHFYVMSSLSDRDIAHSKSGSDGPTRKKRKAEIEKNNDAGAKKKKKKSDDRNESSTERVDLEMILAHLASSKHTLYISPSTQEWIAILVPQTPPVSHSIRVLSALEEYAIDFRDLSTVSGPSVADPRHTPSNPPLRVHFSRMITSVADLVRHTLDLPPSLGQMVEIAEVSESSPCVKNPRTALRATSLLFSRIVGEMGTMGLMCCTMMEQVVEAIVYPLIRSLHLCSIRRTSNLLAVLQSNEASTSTSSEKSATCIDLRCEVVSMLSRIGNSWKCAAHRHPKDTLPSPTKSEDIVCCPSLHELMMLIAALEIFRICAVSDDTTFPSRYEEQGRPHNFSLSPTSHPQRENASLKLTQNERVDNLRVVMAREETVWFLCAFIHTCIDSCDALLTAHGTSKDGMIVEARNALLSVLLVDHKAKKLESQAMVASRTGLNEVESGLIFAAIEAINNACTCPWESERELDPPNLTI